MRQSNLLLVFAKYPVPGFVKTRLAQAIGDANAALVYRHFIEYTLQKYAQQKREFEVHVAVAQDDRVADFKQAFPGAQQYFPQLFAPDLGMRMESAVQQSLAAGYKKVAIIGTDSPHLPILSVRTTFRLLQKKDVVIGPAQDGGYYLIALKAQHPQLFEQIDWGTARVFQQTQQTIQRTGLSCELLPELYDIDVFADLKRLHRDEADIFRQFESHYGERARAIIQLIDATALAVRKIQ